MSEFGIDFAWSRPPLSALIRGGVKFVGRYFSNDPSKNLSRDEYAGYRAHGIGVVVAWETTADRARAGEVAGREDAHRAIVEANSIGYSGPIDFAVDFDAEGPEVFHYFRGARHVAGSRTGVYAGYKVVKYLFDNGLVSHGWQTYAWSSNRWDRRAVIRQYSNGHNFAGADVDYDVALQPVGKDPHDPLNVLLTPERRAANSFIKYRKHPREHAHGLRVTHEQLVRFRQAVWVAAVKGHDLSGKHRLPRGWNVRNRRARYRVLKDLTG